MADRTRSLTQGEVALCRSVFPEPLPYADLRLVEGAAVNDVAEAAFRNGNTAITLRRTVYFRSHYCEDFSAASPEARRLFVHEMVHVWQWRKLGVLRFLLRYLRDLAACRFDAHAMYRYESDERPFARARLEAQAEMVGDLQLPNLPHRRLVEARLAGSGFYGL